MPDHSSRYDAMLFEPGLRQLPHAPAHKPIALPNSLVLAFGLAAGVILMVAAPLLTHPVIALATTILTATP